MIESNSGSVRRALTRRIWREGLWVGAGQGATAIAGFATLKLLTTWLSVDDYGRFALVFGLVGLSSSLLVGPILQTILRFYPDALGQAAVRAFRGMALNRIALGTTVLAIALVAGGLAWSLATSSPISPVAFVLAAVYLFADAIRGMEMSFLNAARRQRDNAVRGAVDAWARPLLVGVAMAILGPGVLQVFLGYAVASILTTLALRRVTVRGEESSGPWRDHPWVRANRDAFLRYALPLVPFAALNWMMSVGDRYLLGGITGAAAVGTYAAAYALASQPMIVANQFVHTTLRPILYEAVSQGDRDKERRVLRVYFAATVGLATLGTTAYAVLAPQLTRGLLGPRFGAAAVLLPWIALAYGLQVVQQTFEVILYAHGLTHRLTMLQAIATVAAATAYLILIPRYGALGAAWGTLASMLLSCVVAGIMASAPRRLAGAAGSPGA